MAHASNHIENYHTAESDDAMRILQKRYVGLIGNVEDYKWQMLALALANGYGRYRNTALLADGAPWIRKMKEKLFPDSVQILDRFHLKENVGKYGAAMITGKGMADIRNEWIQETCEKLDKGEWKEVLIDLERRFKGEKPPAGIVNLPHYITENAECINYPAYRDAGFITSTAAMESSNKSVTQDRLKGPGMRWEIINGQGVLAMKAKKEGGEWKLVEKLLHNKYS